MFQPENNFETRIALICLGIVAVFSAASADSLGDSVDLSRYSIDKDIPYGADSEQVFDLYISRLSYFLTEAGITSATNLKRNNTSCLSSKMALM